VTPKSEDPNQGLLKALQHPFRRALLRQFVEASEKVSPVDLAKLTQEPLSYVSYHVRVLVGFGALELIDQQPSGGSIKHFYRPTALVKETLWVLAALDISTLEQPKRRKRVQRRKKPPDK
jgi:hypothetical protein